MIAFRTTLVLACVSAKALAGHGGYYDDLGYGHGSLYGYGIGGMSYGVNYGKHPSGGYANTLSGKPQIAHGLGHSVFSQHGLNFGGYDRDIAVPSAGFAKGYGLGHDNGGYGAGYAVGYGKAISAPISDAPFAIGKGYGDLSLYGGYGSLAGHPRKVVAPAPIVKGLGGAGLGHGYGSAGFAHGYGSAGLGHGYGSAGLGHGYGSAGFGSASGGYGYRGAELGHAYRGVGVGQAYGADQRLAYHTKGLTTPLNLQKNFPYGDELGYGARYSAPFVSAGSASYAGHGTPVYSGIVKAGVPVSLARKW